MARLKPREARFVIYQGDDMPRLSELKRATDRAKESDRNDAGAEETAAYQAFAAEVAERALEVIIRAIGETDFSELEMAHPPRMVESEPDEQGNTHQVVHEDDDYMMVNTETFPRALLLYKDERVATIELDPPFESDDERKEFVTRELSRGDFEKAWILAYDLNTGESKNPKDFRGGSPESTT